MAHPLKHLLIPPCLLIAAATQAQVGWLSVPLNPVIGISADGTTLVGQDPVTQRAAVWTTGDGLTVLAPYDDAEVASEATCASWDGSVVAGFMTLSDQSVHGFRWSASTGKVDLGQPPRPYSSPQPTAISADGSVIVGRIQSGLLGFTWTAATGMTLFTSPQFETVELDGISADGKVVMGNGRTVQGCYTTFVWSEALGLVGPPCSDGESVVGNGLSGDGLTIVGTDTLFRNLAFRWRLGQGRQYVGSGMNTFAYGTNFDGEVITGRLVDPFSGIYSPELGPLRTDLYLVRFGVHALFENQGSEVRLTSANGDVFVLRRFFPVTSYAYVKICAANCDGSTVVPVLNANDFACFLDRFAAGDARANSDSSSVSPILNAIDFQQFLNLFAAGCP
jgi:uncharacterized membrane protein